MNASIKPPTLLSSLRIKQLAKALCTFRSSLWKVPTVTGTGGTETQLLSPSASAPRALSVAPPGNDGHIFWAASVGLAGDDGDEDDTHAALTS